jgi:hypothetical protein
MDSAVAVDSAKVMRDGIPYIILPKDADHEFVKVMTHAVVEKRTEDYDQYLEKLAARGFKPYEAEIKAARGVRPYEIVEGDYNAMVDNGINALLLLLVGGGGTAFNNANAYLGVGASTTAWNTTQTDLITTPTRKGMKATYPQTGTKKQTFSSDFLTGEANIAWNEWGIFNASTVGTMLSRKQEALGTKSSGTWTLTVDFSLA